MTTYTFRGQITLLSPLAIAMPGTAPASAKDPQQPPVTTVYREGEGLVSTVYLPSSSFRGPLRRAGTEEIFRIRKAEGLQAPFDLRTGFMLNIGGTRGRGSSPNNYDVAGREALRDRNVQIAVFGAADSGDHFFIPGRLSIDHGLPREPLPVKSCPVFPGMRTDDMLRSPERFLSMLDAAAPNAWETLYKAGTESSALKKERKKVVAEANKARGERNSTVHQEKDQRVREIDAALDEGGQSVAMPLAGYQALPAGTVLDHRMVLTSDRPAELGLLLAAIERFAETPYLGGHRSHGCGRFAAQWTLEQRADRRLTVIGNVSIDGEGISEMPAHAVIAESRAAFHLACKSGDFAYRAPATAPAAEETE